MMVAARLHQAAMDSYLASTADRLWPGVDSKGDQLGYAHHFRMDSIASRLNDERFASDTH
jgi:hypothetical protein